jgi:hypothetical protein
VSQCRFAAARRSDIGDNLDFVCTSSNFALLSSREIHHEIQD